MEATSNSHMRRWEFVIIEDQNIRLKLVGNDGEQLIKERDPDKILDDLGFTDNDQ